MGHPTGRKPAEREWVGLPPRPFLYTPDQIAAILGLDTPVVKRKYLWYEGREVGVPDPHRLRAVNIATRSATPEWRVSEQELIRWMKGKKLRYYERGWAE